MSTSWTGQGPVQVSPEARTLDLPPELSPTPPRSYLFLPSFL